MDAPAALAAVTATVDKHHVVGIVAIAIGAVLVVIGGFRVAMRATKAMGPPIIGLVIVVVGVLLYFRAI